MPREQHADGNTTLSEQSYKAFPPFQLNEKHEVPQLRAQLRLGPYRAHRRKAPACNTLTSVTNPRTKEAQTICQNVTSLRETHLKLEAKPSHHLNSHTATHSNPTAINHTTIVLNAKSLQRFLHTYIRKEHLCMDGFNVDEATFAFRPGSLYIH